MPKLTEPVWDDEAPKAKSTGLTEPVWDDEGPVLVPPAPSVAAPPVEPGATDYDEAVVTKIIDSAASVGATVSREEAIRRARNTQALMKAGPDQPVLSQGEAPSSAGTFVEGSLQGMVPFGLGPLVLPPIEGGFSFIPGLEDLSMEAQAQRREENPGTFLAGEIAGSVANLGTSLLAKGASKAAESGAVRLVGGIAGVGERASTRAAARSVGDTFENQVYKATALADELLARRANGDALTKAETELLAKWERRATPTFVEKGIEKIPRIAKGRNAAEISRDAADRVLAERMISDKVASGLENLGFGFLKPLEAISQYAKLTPSRLISPAIDSAIYAGGSSIRDLATMTPEEVASTGETYASKLFKDTLTAGGAGAGLGLVVPIIPTSLRRLSQGVNYGLEKITENLLPYLGSKGTRATSAEIRAAVDATTGVNKIDLRKAEKQFINGLQAQYDNGQRYYEHLQSVLDDALELMDDNERTILDRLRVKDQPNKLAGALDAVRDAYMTKIKVGGKDKYVFKSESVINDLYKGEITYGSTPATAGTPRITFPKAIENLQKETLFLQQEFGEILEQMDTAAPGKFEPALTANMEAKRFGSVMMQKDFLPEELGSFTVPGRIEPEGIYPGEFDVARQTGFPTGVAVAESLAAQIKRGTRGPIELGIYSAAAKFLYFKSLAAAGGSGLAAKTLVDMVFYPGNVIDNYRVVGGLLNRTTEKMDSLSRYLTATKSSYKAAAPVLSSSTKKDTNLAIDAKEAADMYEQDRQFLSQLEGPDGLVSITDQFAGQMDDVETNMPNLASSTNATLPRQAAYMKKKMDQLIGTTPNPTRSQLYQYGIVSRYVRDPETIIDDIIYKKYVPTVAMEVLTEVYPSFLYQLRNNLFDKLAEVKSGQLKLDPTQTLIVDTLLGKQTKGFSETDIRRIQKDMNAAAPKPGEGRGGSPSKRRLEVEQSGTTATLR